MAAADQPPPAVSFRVAYMSKASSKFSEAFTIPRKFEIQSFALFIAHPQDELFEAQIG
jgi:hypothetical protein